MSKTDRTAASAVTKSKSWYTLTRYTKSVEICTF
nr:MAG TPA: hypothetical protein [Caudoviricetes sp.]